MTGTDEHIDLQTLMKAAAEDIHAFGLQLAANDTQIIRRALVRAVLAYVESMTFGLKRWALEYVHRFSLGEQVLLREMTCEITDQGEITVRPAHIQSRRNVRFAFRAFARAFDIEDVCDVSGEGWQSYQAALRVRDRLMHPKRPSDFMVSDAELTSVKAAFAWYHETLALALAAAFRKMDPEAAAAYAGWVRSGRGPRPEALTRHRPGSACNVYEGPLTDDELAQLVDERTDNPQRWLAYRAVHEIVVLRGQLQALLADKQENE